MQPPWAITKNTIRGRRWFPPSSSCDESCESLYAHGPSMQQKCFNYALINLLFGFCISICIIDSLATCFSLHHGAPTPPSYPQSATNEKTHLKSFFFHCFHFGTCIWIFQRVWRCIMQGRLQTTLFSHIDFFQTFMVS